MTVVDPCTSHGCLRAVVVTHADRPFCLDHWRQVRGQ